MSLRVYSPKGPGEITRSGGYNGGGSDPYMSRLVKLVPSEAVGIYPVIMSQANQIPTTPGEPRWAIYIAAWALLLIVVVLRWRATSAPGQGAQWGAILIAAVAFFIWVHVMGGDFGLERYFPQISPQLLAQDPTRSPTDTSALAGMKDFVANLSLMTWTLLAPAVYRGDGGES